MADFRIETDRLALREWRPDDAAAMYAMGQDPRVMQFLGPLMTEADAHALFAGQTLAHSLFGHCFWPIERRSDGAVLGCCGLNPGPDATPLAADFEIGWRLEHDAWGAGYAREAALACLKWARAHRSDKRIGAMTVAANARSRRLMERLGMVRRREDDFDHPALAPGDPLRAHIVYRIERPAG